MEIEELTRFEKSNRAVIDEVVAAIQKQVDEKAQIEIEKQNAIKELEEQNNIGLAKKFIWVFP